MVYVPEGCAHGYLTLVPDTEVYYLTSHTYAPEAAFGVRFDDPLFGIELPIPVVVISEADRSWPDATP
jgi:dTDP-4-dehydrorhamnose 3,5-epimerase